MTKMLRPIGHHDRLSTVAHLDELRSRLIISLAALAVAFGICFWQNHALLHVLNRALPHTASVAGQHGLAAVPSQAIKERKGLLQTADAYRRLAATPSLGPSVGQAYRQAAQGLTRAAQALPRSTPAQEKPITIGVGEPFMTTLTVCAYFALLFSLPLLLYQAYAFLIPALNREERRLAVPVMAAAPLLFALGALFAYVAVLPPAVSFLQGYNSDNFNILVQAKTYYSFEILTMLGIGLAFQLPLGLLALHRLGIINGRTLTRQWRYATVGIAMIAAAMPGADPITSGLEITPLIVLYLASIVMLKLADRNAARRATAQASRAFNDARPPAASATS